MSWRTQRQFIRCWGCSLLKYFRLNPPLKEMVELDEIREEQMEELMRDTRIYIRKVFTDLAVILK